MSSNYIKLACEAYRESHRIPSLTSARIESITDVLNVSTLWSQTNVGSYKQIKFTRTATIAKENLAGVNLSRPLQLGAEEYVTHHGALRGVVRTGEEKDQQLLEVWEPGFLRQAFHLKDIDAHGKIYTDGDFGSLEFSPDSSKLLYVAEKKVAKTLPFLHQGVVAEGTTLGHQFDFRQDWGEQMVGKIDPVVALLDLESVQPATIKILEGIPEGWSPGLVRFWKSGIVGVAYRTTPRKLGKIYCTNRPAILFFLDFQGNFTQLRSKDGDKELGIVSITLSSESGRLVWFERTLGQDGGLYPGAHRSTDRVMALDSRDGEPYQIFSEKQPAFTGDLSVCCGIYSGGLAERCWVDEDTLLISCAQGSSLVPVEINCKAKTAKVLATGNEGVDILDVHAGFVLGSKSGPTTASHLVVASLETLSAGSLSFRPVFEPTVFPELSWQPFLHSTPPSVENCNFAYTSFVVGPKDASNAPLIVWPHGGPHGVITTTFNKTALFFCKLGFSVLFVNYRGSTGHGEENVNSLLGRIGDMDVKDCDYSREVCLAALPNLSPQKVFLLGGSHGGFLVTHLAGQYPDNYKGVVARNPVTNLASMCEVTDIPDWTFNERGAQYAWLHPDPSTLQEMWIRSPIAHIENIKAPIFLMVGAVDLRVPPSQATQFYHSLKALGKEVLMHEYDDNHPLAKPNHDVNVMISAATFYNDIINRTP